METTLELIVLLAVVVLVLAVSIKSQWSKIVYSVTSATPLQLTIKILFAIANTAITYMIVDKLAVFYHFSLPPLLVMGVLLPLFFALGLLSPVGDKSKPSLRIALITIVMLICMAGFVFQGTVAEPLKTQGMWMLAANVVAAIFYYVPNKQSNDFLSVFSNIFILFLLTVR